VISAISTSFSTVEVTSLDDFYRGTGPADAPTVLLLDG
jgi:hypothetical protein